MPSKKNKGRGGRVPAAEAPVPAEEPSPASSSSGSKATSSSAPPSASSATLRLIEGIGKGTPSRYLPSGALRDAMAAVAGNAASCGSSGSGGATGSHAKRQSSPKGSASSAAAASRAEAAEFHEPLTPCDEPDEDEFEDALEELVQSSDEQPEAEVTEATLEKLLEQEPALRIPTPSRENWTAELESLRTLAQDASVPEEQRLRTLVEAFNARVEDLRLLEEHRTASSSKVEDVQLERERHIKQLAAVMSQKLKLEEMCREMQSMKSVIAAESKQIIEEERERQTELNSKFDGAMKEVEEKMQAESEVREHFVKENEELREKLNKFRETYEEQERQVAEQTAVRTKEMQAARDRLKEYETKAVDSGANATMLEKKIKVLKKTNQQLKDELQSILGKFDEFHESVNGSSKRHGECKEEIDGLSAQLKALEDENAALKANKTIEDLTKERDAASRQCDALEKLVGNLEKEIATAREKLRGAKGGS